MKERGEKLLQETLDEGEPGPDEKLTKLAESRQQEGGVIRGGAAVAAPGHPLFFHPLASRQGTNVAREPAARLVLRGSRARISVNRERRGWRAARRAASCHYGNLREEHHDAERLRARRPEPSRRR